MHTDPVAVALKFGFLAVLYLFLLWVAWSATRDVAGRRRTVDVDRSGAGTDGGGPHGIQPQLVVIAAMGHPPAAAAGCHIAIDRLLHSVRHRQRADFAGCGLTAHRIELPGLPPKGDVLDFLAAGGTAAHIVALLQQTTATVSSPAVDLRVMRASMRWMSDSWPMWSRSV